MTYPSSARTSWLELARGLAVADVATALGLELGKPAGGRPTYACPACGAPTRHTKGGDKRGAVGLTGDGRGWRCHQCAAGGDGIDLVSCAVEGRRLGDLDGDGVARVGAWLTERWPELDREAPRRRGGAGGSPTTLARPVRPRAPEPVYPPPGEVTALWSLARPVDGDKEVSAYLEARALEPETLAPLDLCRALPPGSALPSWARGPEGDWLATGHRLLCPLYDSRGALRSLVARAILAAKPKSLAPASFERRGLVLADGLGLQVLRAGGLPSWWDGDVSLRVVLAEGEPDWLSWATSPEATMDSGHGPACLGLFNGGLPAELVARLPRGAEVVIAEQRDVPKGDGPTAAERYTRRIVDTLAPRLRARELTVKVVRP